MKLISIVLVFLLLAIGYISYSNIYHIDITHLQTNLKEWLNRGNSEQEINPEILEVTQIESTTSYITLYQLENGDFGYAQLIKGLNGKYKIKRSGHGTGNEPALYEVIDTNKGKFMVLYGENPNLIIKEIYTTMLIEDTEYKYGTDVSKNKTYIKYEKITDDTDIVVTTVKLTYSDKNNRKIDVIK
jgi:hypothetical protein